MDKVRFGVIGTGGMGSGHLRVMKELEEVAVTAVCDIDPEVCARVSAEQEVPGFVEAEALMDSGLVDAVIVATPHYFHPPISVAAMKKGLHVLSEKPVSVTVAAADEMNRVARETGVKFVVMYQTRSTPRYVAMKKLVDEGRLGKLYRTCCINAWFRTQAYYDSAGWRATWKGEGGGVLINQAPHGIDVFTSLAGLPCRVTAHTGTRRHRIEVEDEVSAMLEYENGAVGFYHTSVTEAPGSDSLELCGEHGKLVVRGDAMTFSALDTPIQEFSDSSDEMWGSPAAREEEVALEERESGHGAIIRNMARAILFEEPLISPGVEGIRTVEFINAVLLSGAKGKPVDLPVDRDEYEDFIELMKRTSRGKTLVGAARRVTDPQFGA
ncbi:MAG: Gfo/Idh/MocA family oxidoreductase [Candidatus Latescibacterota bacterium]